jgi:ParE toxin of type II toxin-antitoxin system, parDE
MSLFRLTKRAQKDLDEIFAYVAEKSGESRATNLIHDIVSTFPTLPVEDEVFLTRDVALPGKSPNIWMVSGSFESFTVLDCCVQYFNATSAHSSLASSS